MANTLTAVPDADVYGIDLLATFDDPSGFITITRVTPAGRTVVRGVSDFEISSSIFAIVDTEVPFVDDVSYEMVHLTGTPATATEYTETDAGDIPDGWYDAFPTVVLRDLFRDMSGINTEFILGPIADTDIKFTGSQFQVIGRPEPVIVVDTKSTQQSTIVFITTTADETIAMREILGSAHPLLLQSPPVFLIGSGTEGVMYFFATSASEQHIIPDGRYPERRFVVNYTEIARPSAAIVFTPPGNTYDSVAADFDTYQDLTDEAISYVNLVYGDVFGYI